MLPHPAPDHEPPIALQDVLGVTESAPPARESSLESLALSQLNAGALVVVTGITAASTEISRLMAMGVCPGQTVEIIQR